MPTPNLWSKLEDAGDVTSPDLGTGGSVVGSPTYPAAKFNNGILSDVDSEGCTFPTGANSINLDKGTIEFWVKMTFDPDPGVSGNHFVFTFRDGTTRGIILNYSLFFNYFTCQVYTTGLVANINKEVDFSVNDLIHFAIVWDREGNDIGGGKTLAIFVNNVLEVSSTSTWAASAVGSNLYIGTNTSGGYHSDMVIDNLKTYDVVKIDFSDKDTEGVEEGVSRTRNIVYDSVLELSRSRDIVYDSVLEGYVTRTRNILYDSILELSKTRDVVYDSVLELSRTRNIIYNSILELSRARNILYDSTLELSQDRDILYDSILLLPWIQRTKPTDTWIQRTKPTDSATQRTKPTDTWLERADTGGPGYDFSMTNIFWDRTDIYFDSIITGPTQRTKPTDTWTQRTKET